MRTLTLAAISMVFLLAGTAAADKRKTPPPAAELPPAKLSVWLDGFHKRDGHPQEQMDIHHFCMAPKGAPIQCALFDGFGEGARLMGVEYIVDAKTYASLPPAEQRLWHSHVYEVTSGALVAPGMTEEAETEFFKGAISTYGKTWHTWDPMLSEEVPLGRPELMVAFTKDGELKPEIPKRRDALLGTNTAQLKASRARTITQIPKIHPAADQGEQGRSCKDNSEFVKARK